MPTFLYNIRDICLGYGRIFGLETAEFIHISQTYSTGTKPIMLLPYWNNTKYNNVYIALNILYMPTPIS